MKLTSLFTVLIGATFLLSCGGKSEKAASSADQPSVSSVMGEVVTRLQNELSREQLDALDNESILAHLSEEEKEVLSTKYWEFSVDQPVQVSVMRDQKQARAPFWLEPTGFTKTAQRIVNGISVYEVWQKDFPAGLVSLGINGFDRHRPVYFVSVAPLEPGQSIALTPIFPQNQHLDTLRVGAFTYHDWDGLKLDSVPESMEGQLLLTTIRGRAREAHLINAFRNTDHPSSDQPDQLVLTLDGDPTSRIVVQWRNSADVESGEVIYWEENSADTLRIAADRKVLEDRLLYNDRYMSRFTARLTDLKPGSRYGYAVRNGQGQQSEVSYFKTAKTQATTGFEFVWFGDTHNDAGWGETIQFANQKFPETAFYLHSGDVVNTGLYRNDWDQFFHYSGSAFHHAPLMAVPGNHDSQDGLGAGLFRDLLAYPQNGPAGYPPGLTYTFQYQNAFFLMMDAASIPVEDQKDWIQQQLASNNADWIFLVVHFPPYNEVEPYPEIVANWVPILEEYGVDMVMSGHFHYYTRSKPLKDGVSNPSGITYLMSVGTSSSREARNLEPFVAKRIEKGNLFQRFRIDGRKLQLDVYDKTGQLQDSLTIQK